VVAHVLRLRAALLFGAVRGHHAVRTAAGLLVVMVATVIVCIAVLSLGDATTGVARTVIVLGGAAVFLAFLVGPMLTGAVDQLDPRRFAVFGVDERRMPWILALASLISVPSFALLAVTTCVVIVGIRLGVPAYAAVLTGLLGLVTTVLAARVGMAISAMWLPERRSRELTALFTLAVVVIAFPVAVFLASLEWDGEVPAAVDAVTSIVGATPVAAPLGLLFALASGDTAAAWISGVVAVISLIGITAAWILLVRRLLTTTERPVTARERTGLGWFALLPSNAFGAIAARSLVYWLRDRRYIVNIVVVPIAGVLTVFPLLVAGVPFEVAVLVPVPVMALFFGWLPHNDIAYDSTAFWVHVASGVRGLPDRFGRLIPIFLVAVPALAVAVPVTLALTGGWRLLLPLSGLAICLFFAGLGLSSVVSVIAPYAVSRPGDSPFQQPQRAASRGAFGQAGVFVGAILLAAPTVWLFSLAVVEGGAHTWTAFWTGIGTGIGVLLIGTAVGGRIFESSGERLMEFVETA
jgi:ABC-2 type transport system permease protein